MRIVNKKLTIKEFEAYVSGKDFGQIKPGWLVIHHTWKPTKEQWQGSKSIQGLKRFYESKGWPVGPHLFIAEDGIWLFTDMDQVGIHAGKGNALWKHKRTGRIFSGYTNSSLYRLMDYSIGIEVVGNYDYQLWSGKTYDNAVGAIKILMKYLQIDTLKIKFHRDYSSKSCPGWAINKDWLFKQLSGYVLKNPINDLKVYDFWKKADPIYANLSADSTQSNFDAQFKLKNTGKQDIQIQQLALAVHDNNNKFITDLTKPETKKPRYLRNLRLKPNKSLHFQFSETNLTKPGKYQVIAKALINKQWFHLQSLNFKVEPVRFSDMDSIQAMRQVIFEIENKLKNNFGSKLTSTEKQKIIDWVKSKRY
ncbi:MAG: hypothetical protein GF332_02805 [Candidatus Moranbacteria bacterium]|nr:hypothetical protein [Candidatus Moranbacteria bacterium]